MIIDAKNMIVGRVATYAAKQALLGQKVDIINCDKAVVTGRPTFLKKEVREKFDRSIPSKGPFIPKRSDRYVRRIVRGMLPYKKPRGIEAFKRIMCHIGTPAEFEGKDLVIVDGASVAKVPNLQYVMIRDLCQSIGGKQ